MFHIASVIEVSIRIVSFGDFCSPRGKKTLNTLQRIPLRLQVVRDGNSRAVAVPGEVISQKKQQYTEHVNKRYTKLRIICPARKAAS